MSKKIHTENEVYAMLNAKLANRTQSSLADEIGLSRSYFNEIVRRLRPPSSEVLRYLGLRKHVVYVDWSQEKE